jgi:ribonuclease Z
VKRADIQEPFIRDQEIPLEEYHSEGYQPSMFREWPVESDIVIPMEAVPPQMVAGMGAAWREKRAYKKHIGELAADS